jgi:hypothetical protein
MRNVSPGSLVRYQQLQFEGSGYSDADRSGSGQCRAVYPAAIDRAWRRGSDESLAPPSNNAGNSMCKDVDTVLTWPNQDQRAFYDRAIDWGVQCFSTLLTSSPLASVKPARTAEGSRGSPNGTIAVTTQVTMFSAQIFVPACLQLGAPREMEFGLRIDF